MSNFDIYQYKMYGLLYGFYLIFVELIPVDSNPNQCYLCIELKKIVY